MMQPVFAEPVIILVAESLHSSKTVKILAVWFTVVSVNWYLLIWGIYFNSKCRSQFERIKCLHGEKKATQFILLFFCFCFVCIPLCRIPQVFTM